MQSINISKRKFDNLKRLELPKEVMSTEANFYRFNYLGKVKVFKSLHKTKGPLFANKLFTLEMLNEYREILPDNFVIPETLVSVDKEVRGFALPFIKGITLESYLANKNFKTRDKIEYIRQIGDLLNSLSHLRKDSGLNCIYLNDLHASNFMVDPKKRELKVLDLDSCRICDSKPFPARYLTPLSLLNKAPGNSKYDIYRKEVISDEGTPILELMSYEDYESYYCRYKNYKEELGYVNSNENSDLYCYTILFLNYLYGSNVGSFTLEEFYEYIFYLEKIGFDQELMNAIMLIVTGAPNENIEPYLETVTEEQVARANQKVYKALKKV